jgi:UV excision repair protein RAD23
LRNNAQFQQLRQVVQQQPQMLEPILQQLGAGNPQLAQLIANNPEQFLSLLGEDVDDDVPLPPGAQAIAVTEEERDAIERVSYTLALSTTRNLFVSSIEQDV